MRALQRPLCFSSGRRWVDCAAKTSGRASHGSLWNHSSLLCWTRVRQTSGSSIYQSLHDKGRDGGPHIRVMELLPGRDADPVISQLHSVPLSSVPPYEALSYCWGDLGDTRTITCNGTGLSIPRRLETALKSMRYQSKSRVLWADAICINQTDNQERKIQVQLMRDIFASAERTLIWIGDEEERRRHKISKFALLSIKVGLHFFRRRLRGMESPKIPISEWQVAKTIYLEPFSSDFYLECIGLLRQPWFHRAWIVQEVAVSNCATILWGGRQYEWDDVVKALKFMSKVDFPLAFIVTLEHIGAIEEETQFYRSGSQRLLSVLSRHRRCEATDLRDKVFSFVGLVKPSPSLTTSVDVTYEKNVEAVYTQTTRAILEMERNLDILSSPPHAKSSRLDLSSWVADWSCPPASSLTYTWGHGPLSLTSVEISPLSPRFSASAKTMFETPVTSNDGQASSHADNRLVIEGYVVDTVTQTGPIYEGSQTPNQVRSFPSIVVEWYKCIRSLLRARKVFIAWQKMAYPGGFRRGRSLIYEPTKETLRTAFLNTVSTGEAGTSESTPALEFELQSWEKSARIGIIGLSYSAWTFVSHFLSNEPFMVFELQGRYSLQRRMIRTSGGYLGLASAGVKVGDAMILAKGGSVPLILRRKLSEEVRSENTTSNFHNEEWRLVGDAYIHGIMHGEVWDESRCKNMILT